MPHYEYHKHNDFAFKIIFHKDILTKETIMPLHWHSSPEFLYIIDGEITVICDGKSNNYTKGEIAVINSNQLHQISVLSDNAVYYCLILDKTICFDFSNMPERTSDSETVNLFKKIIEEMENKKTYYRETVIGYSKSLFSLICRQAVNGSKTEQNSNLKKVSIVKRAAQFINENYQKNISLEEISNFLNINKYYLSHIFKEISGSTIIEQLNYIRCTKAKTMLKSGKYNVSECCFACGFANLSYFSKTYKKIIGNSPVNDLKTT